MEKSHTQAMLTTKPKFALCCIAGLFLAVRSLPPVHAQTTCAYSGAALMTSCGNVRIEVERVNVTAISNPYFLLAHPPVFGSVLVFRNGLLIDDMTGAGDYAITGNKIVMQAKSGGMIPGDRYRFIYWTQVVPQ